MTKKLVHFKTKVPTTSAFDSTTTLCYIKQIYK